ncbi:CHAT domain-containing protein [Ideonella sp. YS5]|uniref:CHAT domain-containing protein n=1 Tax=Ideonella sp. YS5 TaxID=3453714 RepID=UPI003EEA0CC2
MATPPEPAALAQALMNGGPLPAAPDEPDEAIALAWALKDACYAAWSSEPRRAVDAAARLHDWLARLQASRGDGDWREVRALAHWTRGIAEVTDGRMTEAVASFDAAATDFDALQQPGPAAQTQVPKIMALGMLGRHAEAQACAERTQAAFVGQGNWHAAAKVGLNLGSLNLRQDDYAPAARHYREAARLFARAGDSEHSVMADIGLADALTAQGDLDEAERIYTRAGVRAAAHGLPVLGALVHESMALLDLSRGRYGAALAGFERSRSAYETLAMPQHLAIAEKQLADAYLELRLLPEAERLHGLALSQFDALQMPDDRAWTLAQLGRGRALQGRAAQAGAAFDEALALFDAEGNAAGRGAVALARAELALSQQDAAAALEAAQVAFAAYADAGADDGAARAALVRAEALRLAGRPAKAFEAFDAALGQARQQRRLAAEVRALVGRSLAEQALGRDAAARAGFEAAVALFEDLRLALPGDEIRRAFLADQLRPYRALLHYALADHEREPTPAHAEAVLLAADRLRARTLSERLAVVAQAEAPADADTAALRARVSWLARRAEGLQDDDDVPSPALREELQASEQSLLERVRRQRLAAATPAATSDGLDARRLAATLGPGDALLEFALDGDELFACLVRPDGIDVHRRLASWPDVLQAVQAARFQLEALGHGAAASLQDRLPTLAARCDARLAQVHALVWAPLEPLLHGVRRVLLVAPPPLSALPFGALHDGQAPLAARFELAWVPSAAHAASASQRVPSSSPGAAFVLGESSRLPHAGAEAREVAAALPGATLRLDAEATIVALRSPDAAAAGLLHLACHAQSRTDSPTFSALHLADGALTAEQVEALRLSARVVVLSGCETAAGDDAIRAGGGDEWVGLVRAFLLAGAGRVVASLWPVDDRITAGFMSHLYAALAAGTSPAAALRHAQLTWRTEHPHPFHWAAFALYGGL